MTLGPLYTWTPECKYTRIDLVQAEAGDPGKPELTGGNNAMRSNLPASQFGLLTGEYPDYGLGYFTQEGAEALVQEYVWDADLAEATALTFDEWAQSVAYAVGDIVQHLGMCYQVIQAHTSQAGWEPPAVPALFNPYDPSYTTQPWVQPEGAHDAYAVGAQVTHAGSTWTSNTPDNVWEPGVFGWDEDVPPPPEGTWQVGVAYDFDEIMTYAAIDYRCISAHISQAGWEPPNVPALWSVII